ncbi:hypothetical protein AOLI_G00102880 [Acnodon oligacanthus]
MENLGEVLLPGCRSQGAFIPACRKRTARNQAVCAQTRLCKYNSTDSSVWRGCVTMSQRKPTELEERLCRRSGRNSVSPSESQTAGEGVSCY